MAFGLYRTATVTGTTGQLCRCVIITLDDRSKVVIYTIRIDASLNFGLTSAVRENVSMLSNLACLYCNALSSSGDVNEEDVK